MQAVRCGCLVASSLLAMGILAQEDVSSRYWRMLNEGRDVEAFESVAEQLTFPARRKLNSEVLNREAARGDGVLVAASDLTLAALALGDGSVQWRAPAVDASGAGEGSVLADAPPQLMQAPVTCLLPISPACLQKAQPL